MGDSIGLVIEVLTAAAAVGACVFQVGRVIRTIEVIGEKVDKMAGSLDSLATSHSEHGERLARLETRADVAAGRR